MSTPIPTLRFYTFWSINDRLDQRRLQSQLDDMQAMGFDGAVFHPRFYPNDPPYMSAPYLKDVSDLILYAKSIGMEFWIYDENGWPIGTAGGLMLQRHPENASVWVELSEQKTADTIHSFQQAPGNTGKNWHLNTHRCRALDCLDPVACQCFLDITHEGYRKHLAPEAFDYVSAIFSDEPEFGLSWDKIPPHGNIPWTKNMPSLWKERYGEDLLTQLPLMFFPGEGYRAFRIRYWEFCTDLLAAGFFDPYLAWCKQHGKTFTAHVKGEEHPMFQVTMSGSCHRIFQHIALPGIDALERFPSNNFFPRQVTSVAQQFGDGRSMVECFGGAGWGAGPEDLERYLNWLGSHGLTHYVLHLYQYRLISNAIRDWPPSEPNHLTWREIFPVVLKRFKDRFASLQPRPADTLVVAPYRGIMAEYDPSELARTNIHIASPHPDSPAARLNDSFMAQVEELYAAGVAYHVCDERTLEESGRVDGNRLALGNCRYSQVLLADGTIFNTAGQQLLTSLREAKVGCSQLLVTPVDAPTALAGKPPVAPSAEDLSMPIDLQWHATPPSANHLLLEPSPTTDGGYSATFKSQVRADVEFFFADDVAAASLNGHDLKLHPAEDGTVATVPMQYLASNNQLNFRGKTTLDRPFVWLRGPMLVRSRSAYVPGPNHTIKTEGPFEVIPAEAPDATALVESGLPFCHVPVICESDFALDLPIAAGRLQLVGILADAAKLSLDGKDLGFVYGPDWIVMLPTGLSPGRHRLTLSLFPSTYNHYGPHHYIDGDHRIISPHQYDGRKSFADRADAPENTHVSAWHFKPLRAPQRIRILLP